MVLTDTLHLKSTLVSTQEGVDQDLSTWARPTLGTRYLSVVGTVPGTWQHLKTFLVVATSEATGISCIAGHSRGGGRGSPFSWGVAIKSYCEGCGDREGTVRASSCDPHIIDSSDKPRRPLPVLLGIR